MKDCGCFVVLDAVMGRGSVTPAAQDLGMHVSAVSRMLGQLRELYGDPIFVRAWRQLVPTPFAISLGPVIAEALTVLDALLAAWPGQGPDKHFRPDWVRRHARGVNTPFIRTHRRMSEKSIGYSAFQAKILRPLPDPRRDRRGGRADAIAVVGTSGPQSTPG